MTLVTTYTSATSSDDYSATLPLSYRHKSTSSSKLAKMNAPYFPSESSFYTLHTKRNKSKMHTFMLGQLQLAPLLACLLLLLCPNYH